MDKLPRELPLVLLRNQQILGSLTGLHLRDVILLVVKHFTCGKMLAQSRALQVDLDKFTRPNAPIQGFPHFTEGRLTHRAPEGIAHQIPFVDDSLPFHVAVTGIGDGFLCQHLSFFRAVALLPASGQGTCYHSLRLIAESVR